MKMHTCQRLVSGAKEAIQMVVVVVGLQPSIRQRIHRNVVVFGDANEGKLVQERLRVERQRGRAII
jgi:hypothetical protein